ncbi:ribosome maturation factor RimP [Microaerobacter geothermalis]|uniref:ribosome maturation factor RimP n=1 Tax=Microaerobacter geothermalis TaxID=674972 RepID=UPI001F1762E9|nr:ribosome maturation factor RimP [Microaerobacter geothermalis]MCF6093194.1 ribosome maturation factor RimP [Microaerobacter geothermalis]
MPQNVTGLVERLVIPILDEQNLELVDIEFTKEAANWFLRIYIDKDGGVDIEDCGRVSEQLSKKLDEADPIPQAYFLEVSSPGAERPLKKEKDYLRAVGKYVHIETCESIDDHKVFEGTLSSYENGELVIKEKNNHWIVPVDKILSARLAIKF